MEEIAMTVSPTLQKYLDQSVTYDLIPHAPTMSSTRTAEACHVPGEALAKAVVLRRDGGYMMAVLPASRHLHLSALRSQLGHRVDLGERGRNRAAVRGLRPRGRTAARRMLRAGRHHRRQHRCAAARLYGKRRSRHADPHGRRAVRKIDGEGLARPLQHTRLRPRVPPAAPLRSRFKQDAPRLFAIEQTRAVWDDLIATGRRFSGGLKRSSRTRTSNRWARTG